MTDKPPKALRLAQCLEEVGRLWEDEAAVELRRLHKENKALVEALNKIKAHMDTDEYAWGVAAEALAKAQGENHGA